MCQFGVIMRLAWCNNCNNVSAQGACKSKAYLRLSVLKDDESKLQIDISHSIIERKFDLSLSNTAENVTLCKLINKIYFLQLINSTSVSNLLIIDSFSFLLNDHLNNWLQHCWQYMNFVC